MTTRTQHDGARTLVYHEQSGRLLGSYVRGDRIGEYVATAERGGRLLGISKRRGIAGARAWIEVVGLRQDREDDEDDQSDDDDETQ